jgi:hypothetical protein
MQAYRIAGDIAQTHSQPALEEDGWSTPRSGCSLPGKDMVPSVEKSGCVSGPIWRAQKISPAPGLDIPAVQPIASRYTYYAIKRKQWQGKCSYLTKLYFITFLKTTNLITCN